MPQRNEPITGQVEIGDRVMTADGAELGVVAELTTKDLKVDAPRRRDFWLSRQDIAETASGSVTMRFGSEHIDRHEVPTGAYHPAEGGAPPDRAMQEVLSEEQTGEQRERMLREMVEGRQRLPHEHPQGEDSPPDTGGTFGEPVESELARYEGMDPRDVVRSARDIDTKEPEGGGGTGAVVEQRDDTHAPPEPPSIARATPPPGAAGLLPQRATAGDAGMEEREWLPLAPAAVVAMLVLAITMFVLLVRRRRARSRSMLGRLRR